MTEGEVDRRAAALDRAISPPRYSSFLVAAGGDASLARALYVWDRDVAAAVFADLAVVEVALRNAMHDALSSRWGNAWYDSPSVVLDRRSSSQLRTAKDRLPSGVLQARSADVPGRVVAQCMFGFWVNLLDRGGRTSTGGRTDYEQVWRSALSRAFPGGRTESAKMDGGARFTRDWVHGVAKTVNDLRNRVAHHEPLLNGFPLNGQRTRLSVEQGVADYLRLTRMIDRDLAAWIEADSRVQAALSARPK